MSKTSKDSYIKGGFVFIVLRIISCSPVFLKEKDGIFYKGIPGTPDYRTFIKFFDSRVVRKQIHKFLP